MIGRGPAWQGHRWGSYAAISLLTGTTWHVEVRRAKAGRAKARLGEARHAATLLTSELYARGLGAG